MDFALVDTGRLAVVDAVVTEVARATGAAPDTLLLIGAEARDILHAAQGHLTALRGTTDVDIGIAIADWSVYERIEAAFPRTGDTGIRFLIGGCAVDVMPFGPIEDPRGVSRPRVRGDDTIVVFGFADALRRAMILPLPSGETVRLPRVEGYTALKMRAWIDRSPAHEVKDAYDLAVALHWYIEDPMVEARAWEEEELIVDEDGDLDVVKAALLGADSAAALSPRDRDDLVRRWSAVDLDRLAAPFSFEPGRPWAGDPARARRLLGSLTRGLASWRGR